MFPHANSLSTIVSGPPIDPHLITHLKKRYKTILNDGRDRVTHKSRQFKRVEADCYFVVL